MSKTDQEIGMEYMASVKALAASLDGAVLGQDLQSIATTVLARLAHEDHRHLLVSFESLEATEARIEELETALMSIHTSCQEFNTGCSICSRVFREKWASDNE